MKALILLATLKKKGRSNTERLDFKIYLAQFYNNLNESCKTKIT